MKLIELTQGRVAIVDDEDFGWLSKWKWHYHRDKAKRNGYAERTACNRNHRQTILMHVAILKRRKLWKSGIQVDHINTCGCDNRKENLRLATRSGQTANIGCRSNNSSGVTGVYWRKDRSKWCAYIRIDKKKKHLGNFNKMKDAVAARYQAEIKHFGEYRHDSTNVCPLGNTGKCPDCAARLKEMKQ